MIMSKFRGCTAIAAALVCLATYQPSRASAQLPSAAFRPVPVDYDFQLAITSVPPPPYIENTPIPIGFRLTVGKVGVAGQLPPPLTGYVCGLPGPNACTPATSLRVGRVINSTVMAQAVAGAAVPLTIQLQARNQCGGEFCGVDVLAEASTQRPVAARYEIALSGIEIDRTRSLHEDSVKISLQASVDGQRSADADACAIVGPPVYCIQNVPQGNHNDGRFAPKDAQIGPYDLVPEVDPDLKLGYVVVNLGTTYEQRAAQKLFDQISNVTAGVLNAYSASSGGGGNGWSGLNDFTHSINAMQFGGCDGPVAVDAASLLNKTISDQHASTLEALTHATGSFTRTDGIFEIDSQDGCGRSGKYKVTWTVTRTSWRPPS